ncbi:MAG: hypothetical protein WCD31_06870 [Gillisia sp.]
MKKFFVLGILFLLPIVAYLFFASGVNHFAKLPVLTKRVQNVNSLETRGDSAVTFLNKISIVAFFGKDPESLKENAFNLDQKILQKYYGFNDFQFVMILPKEAKSGTDDFIADFGKLTKTDKWKFVYGTDEQVKNIFKSFNTTHSLNQDLQTPYVFIVDKDAALRGRDDDEDAESGLLYGYDTGSVAELNDKMDDDVKVILAEYRLELKKYKEKINKRYEK